MEIIKLHLILYAIFCVLYLINLNFWMIRSSSSYWTLVSENVRWKVV